MAKTTQYSIISTDEAGTKLHCIRWEPEDGAVIATLQIIHGMQEHIERYDEFARFLADRGFAVFGHDHIGHGLSVSDDNDRGKMHTSHPDDTMVDDMYANYLVMRDSYPGKPHFVLGHSMGSYLLRKFLVVKSKVIRECNGAIIMGTGTENDAAILAGTALCKTIMAAKGRDSSSSLIKGLMFGSQYKKFDVTGEHPENSWLSKNVENVRMYMDPSNKRDGGEFSLNGYMILLRSTYFDNRMSNIRQMNMDIPVIFVSGEEDPVGAMGKGVRSAYEKFKAAGVRDLSIKLYEGDRHEILNELDRATVYEDLYKWMQERF